MAANKNQARRTLQQWDLIAVNNIKNQIYLTNRFHVAVRLLSNRSQMTSKCGKINRLDNSPRKRVMNEFFIVLDQP